MIRRALLCFAMLAAARAQGGGAVDPLFAAAKLRAYCKACHAVGDYKFVLSDDDRELWAYLFANRAPRSGKLWADGIIEVLNWPSDEAPPFDRPMDPLRNRDWMPKGSKRLDLAADFDQAAPVRRLILSALQEARETWGPTP